VASNPRAAVIVAALAAGAAAGPALGQAALGLGPLQNAGAIRERTGETFTFVCPALEPNGDNVYGTDTYTESSPICPAAIHAGVLKPGRAGLVTLVVGRGAKEFKGTERNGVRTSSYGAWPYSYQFRRSGEPGNIAWNTVWNGIPMDFSEPIAVRCPPDGSQKGALWGTDVYSRDSTICLAAVHVGAITLKEGGNVTVQRAPAAKEFLGSLRYGIESKRWSGMEDAFLFASSAPPPPAAPPPEEPPASPPPPGPVIASRSIAIAGFTGVGPAPIAGPIGVRTIALAGYTGVGPLANAGPINARSIATAGWTGVGPAP
jgi:hypothetical protein